MNLDNYLLELSEFDRQRNGESDRHTLHIWGIEEIIKSCLEEIKNSLEHGEYLKLVCSYLNVKKPTVDSWSSGYNAIPIRKMYRLLILWKKTCKKTNKQFSEKWDAVYRKSEFFSSTKNTKVRLPKKLDEDLAYFIGFMLADGHIKDDTKNLNRNIYPEHSISACDNSYQFMLYFKKLFDKIFQTKSNEIRYSEDKSGSWFVFRCTSKPIHRFLTDIIGFPKGYKSGNVNVLKIIERSPLSIQKSFIAGFCDGEGGVGITAKGPWFEIAQKSNTCYPSKILIWIKQKFDQLNLDFNGPSQMKQNAWRLRTSKRNTILNYYKIISPRHPDKIAKLEKIKVLNYAHRT